MPLNVTSSVNSAVAAPNLSSDVWLKRLVDLDPSAVTHLTLGSEQEQFAGSVSKVFTQLQQSRYRNEEHPFLIISPSSIVGFFVLREMSATPDWASKNAITLHSFRIGQSYQGRGYGRSGVDLAVQWIARFRPSVKSLMLSVNVRNELAKRVYLKCGFVDTGETCMGSIGSQNILHYDITASRTISDRPQ